MPTSIPAPLAAYIADCLSADTQTLVTSVLSTPPPWLLLRLLYATIYGVGDTPGRREQTGRKVVFVSLLRPLSLWIEMGKKMGLDLPSLLKSRRITYIDGLTVGIMPGTGIGTTASLDVQQAPTVRLTGLALKDIESALDTALRAASISTASSTTTTTTTTTPTRIPASSSPGGIPSPRVPPAADPLAPSPVAGKPVVFIDGIDFLLASQQLPSAVGIQSFLATLRTKCHALMLTCQADAPLLHSSPSTNPDTGTPLERNHAYFLITLAHSSRWVFQLRGLDTGSAKDVSGVVRASRGGDVGIDESSDESQTMRRAQDLIDGEWLYQIKGDGSVRVWARGE